jgi:hypothetical protein
MTPSSDTRVDTLSGRMTKLTAFGDPALVPVLGYSREVWDYRR